MHDQMFQRTRILMDSHETLSRAGQDIPGDRLLVFSGEHVHRDATLRRMVTDLFSKSNHQWEVVSGAPEKQHVEHFVERTRHYHPDVIVAIGGGSVMDTAKIVSVVATNAMSVDDTMIGNWSAAEKKTFLVTMPTLFGSGSEVTPFAVLFANRKKYSIDHPFIQPDLAIIEPQLGLSLSHRPAAAAYLDALAQSVESLWSRNGTAESAKSAWQCLKHLADVRVMRHAGDERPSLARASLFGGCAIGISRTTLAHALSYPLTIHYAIPHGIACAVFLPEVLQWNAEVTDEDCTHPLGAAWVRQRINDIARLICGRPATPAEAVMEIRLIASEVGIDLSLDTLGVPHADHAHIAAHVGNPERLGNNPRRVTPEAIREIVAHTANAKD